VEDLDAECGHSPTDNRDDHDAYSSQLVPLLMCKIPKLPTDSYRHATRGDSRQDLSANDAIDQAVSNHLNEVQYNNDLAGPPAHRIPSKGLVTN
jgi:hypothetical protein